MSYTVEQAAKKLQISRTAIYQKLKQDTFKPFATTDSKGRTVISEDLLRLIEDSLPNRHTESSIDLQGVIDVLTNQLQEKDKVISDLLRLTENQQILLGNSQRQQEEVKMIDEPKKKGLFSLLNPFR